MSGGTSINPAYNPGSRLFVRSSRCRRSRLTALATPLLPLLRRLWPDQVLTTGVVGRAMLEVARRGAPAPVLETADINRMGA